MVICTFYLCFAFDDIHSAFANRDQGAVACDLVGDGVLEFAGNSGVFQRIFAPFDADPLCGLGEGEQRQVAEAASCQQHTGGVQIADSVIAVGDDGMNALLAQIL